MQQDDEIRIKIVGLRVDATDIVRFFSVTSSHLDVSIHSVF